MNLANNITINVYSIGILLIIYVFSIKQNDEKTLQNKLYKNMLKLTILMLVVDILSRFDGNQNTIYPVINHVGNFLIFLLSPVIPSLWLLYVHDQIFQDEKRTKQLLYLIYAVNGVNLLLLIATQTTGWYYRIESGNIYQRGPLFWIAGLLTCILVLAASILTMFNREKMNKKQFFSLLFFAVPPLLCIILQILYYGISIILNGIVFSMLIVALNIQNYNMYTDYLTGVYNRKKLETYLKQKVSLSRENKTFSAIMIDLDNFKVINDCYGHDVGDNALQVCTKLISGCLKSNDFIARFGGDEFFIILNMADEIRLKEVVARIKNSINNYNMTSGQPYELSCSMGYAVYGCNSGQNAEEFQKQLDTLMYENKQRNKEKQRKEQFSGKIQILADTME